MACVPHEDSVKSDDFYFAESKPLSALRYAFILRKRTGAIIPKAIYNKLMAEVKAMRPQAESAPAQQESQPAAAAAGEAPAEAEQSPLARQWSEMKAKHSDAILLFRVGSFYESFGDDAVAVSDILGLTLTRRSRSGRGPRRGRAIAHHPPVGRDEGQAHRCHPII